MISFTYDIPSNHQDQKMPVLDLKVYLNQDGIIFHKFYEKITKNKFVILADSALSWQSKRTILTQEALRIMRNTSVKLDPDILNSHLSRFMLKLKDSGYSSKFRSEIIQSAKNAFNIQLEKDRKGIRPLFRDKAAILKNSENN